MSKWFAAACVALVAAAAPLFAPQWWAQHGAFPDLAALAVLHLAFFGTPERAAVLGVAIGLARSLWTSAPFGLEPALYGALGWSGAHFGRATFHDRALFRMAVAGVGVIALRVVFTTVAAATTAAPAFFAPANAASVRGMSAATWWSATVLAALATAAAAPVVSAALSGSRVLAGFERRRRHDV